MKCILNGREVLYPCSRNCPLFGDCTVMFQRDTKPVVTNADRIRSMSDEELAERISGLICDINQGVEYHENPNTWLEWLKQPHGEG